MMFAMPRKVTCSVCLSAFSMMLLAGCGSSGSDVAHEPQAKHKAKHASQLNQPMDSNTEAPPAEENAAAESTAEQNPPQAHQNSSNEPQIVRNESGLEYFDIVEGTGASPQPGQYVTVHYTGTLQDGTVFDSSVERGKPFQFHIGQGQVIRGWDEGVMSMKIGGKRKLIVPPHMGYGAAGFGNVIPPNSTLIFEVDLLGVQ